MGERLYGLDWLRIGAFALLILYHIGMFFVPWDWHIKAEPVLPWLESLMLATSPWRLSLLFLVSGVASAFLLDRERPARFAGSRTVRLLLPLIVAMALFVPPQPWVELSVKHGYTQPYWQFWTEDYFRFEKLSGLDLPTWNHLWFVAYLWVYSLLFAGAAASTGPAARTTIRRAGEWLLGSWRVLVLPLVALALLRSLLFPIFPETHGLLDDWYNHAAYLLVFAIGVLLAHSSVIRAAFIAWRVPAAVVGLVGYAGYAGLNILYPEGGPEPSEAVYVAFRTFRAIEAWGAIVALVGFALGWKVGDSPARRYLTEAVFPYYIVHQTIIVLVAWWLRPLALGNGPIFAILLAATMVGCAIAYELARRSGPLRPLFGLRANPPKSRSKSHPAVAH